MSAEDVRNNTVREASPPSVQQWFNDTPGPQLQPPIAPKRKKRFLLVAGGILAVALVVFIAVRIYFQPPHCIDTADYAELEQNINKIMPNAVGALEANLDSPIYTFEVFFDGSTARIQGEDNETNELIRTTSEFYISHTSTAPLSFRLAGSYSQTLPRELVDKRLQSVKKALQEKGVSTEHIIVTNPSELSTDDDYAGYDSPIYVSIQPESKCHTN